MDKVCWIIDDIIREKHDEFGFPPLDVAAREQGHIVIPVSYRPFTNDLDPVFLEEVEKHQDNPVVVHCCIGFLKQWQRSRIASKVCPGVYCKHEELKVSNYSAIFGSMMLNDDFVILPFGEVVRRGTSFFGTRFFIRPNVVTKSFSGRVIDTMDISETFEALNQYEPIDNDELCVIASPKEILCESRHLIVDGKVVTGSTYQYNGVLDIKIDVHPAAHAMAEFVAKHPHQIDYVYIVDVAVLVDGSARIVEANSMSCSGMYGMSTPKVVETVSIMAMKEFVGDL